jgi:cation diffusion facilitator family transporter
MPRFLQYVPRIEARSVFASLTAAICLLALKFLAYFLTNSSAIFSDAMETIANVAGAGFALYALHTAHRPADSDHPYGHGKIEFISAGFEGSMILTAALVAALGAITAILHHADVKSQEIGVGLVLMVIALAVNSSVGIVLTRVGRRADSAALMADGKHLLSDVVTSVAAIIGLIIVRLTNWKYADPIAALVVAGYIGRTGATLMRGAVSGLMDEQDEHDEALLRSILDAHVGPAGREPHVCSYHKLRHRHSGRYHWVDFHLVVPQLWNVQHGHDVASEIEGEIESALGVGNATAHVEPCNEAACPLCIAKT